MIPRFYDVEFGEGHHRRGGRAQRSSFEGLRSQIGVVFQETFLFSTSIRENIAFARRDATMEEIVAAAKMAQAHDFIEELPDGYETLVGERGLGLSGGQKQRIAIARAILADPRIVILDDATASVDMETEHEIQEALKTLMKGRTTFIIAHRISSVKDADQIIVLDRGPIVERGTHEELLAARRALPAHLRRAVQGYSGVKERLDGQTPRTARRAESDVARSGPGGAGS